MISKLQEAIKLKNNQQYQEAETLLTELYSKTPSDPQVNYHFAALYDRQGKETQAIPYYEAAITNGLSGSDLRGALLGLGSTYRTIGEYDKSVATLRKGQATFPDAKEFPVFLAMALYNVSDNHEAVTSLLKLLLEVTDDEGIQRFKRAIMLYAEDLERMWRE